MALFLNGQKLANLAYKGQTIGSIYYKGRKIYSNKIPVGFVMWNGVKAFGRDPDNMFWGGFTNDNLLINQNVKLNKPISKLNRGLKFTATNFLDGDNPNSGPSINYKIMQLKTDSHAGDVIHYQAFYLANPDMSVSASDLNSGNKIKLVDVMALMPSDGSISNVCTLYVQKIDDNTITFISPNEGDSGGKEENNSTAFTRQTTAYNNWLIIDSITAY